MSAIRIFSGIFCGESALLDTLANRMDLCRVTDEGVIRKASGLSGLTCRQIQRAFAATSVFNSFTFEREQAIAYIKLALASRLQDGDMLFTGYTGLLLPERISHILRVCLVAESDFRMQRALARKGTDPDNALEAMQKSDGNQSAWAAPLLGNADPWSPGCHDMVIPMDQTGAEGAADLISQNLTKDALRPTPESRSAIEDFHLASSVEAQLLDAGHLVGVQARQGQITLTLHHPVLMGQRLAQDLVDLVSPLPGVISVDTRREESQKERSTYRRHNFDLPSRVLLVDDEREFVQTLSERLQMREMGSAVAYDGYSALDLVKTDDPDVMIIDLKMPEIDGMEVLKKVKKTRPEIEVIVLTGHGSEQDRQQCLELGAFAYLQKPVDIDILSQTLKQAYDKTRHGTGV